MRNNHWGNNNGGAGEKKISLFYSIQQKKECKIILFELLFTKLLLLHDVVNWKLENK